MGVIEKPAPTGPRAEPVKLKESRRHALQVTADRLEQAAREYPQLWDAVERAAIERVSRKMRIAVEQGVESLDQRARRV